MESLVKAQAAGGHGLAFRAVSRVTLRGELIDIEFPPPSEPELIEVAKGHRVACFLYPTGIHGESVWPGGWPKPA